MRELLIKFDQRGDTEVLSGRYAHVYLDGKKLEKCTGVSFELTHSGMVEVTVRVLAKDINFEGPCNVVFESDPKTEKYERLKGDKNEPPTS